LLDSFYSALNLKAVTL